MSRNLTLAFGPDSPKRCCRRLIGARKDPTAETGPHTIVAHARRDTDPWRRFALV